MDFSDALRLLKAGRRVRRLYWGSDRWLYFTDEELCCGTGDTSYAYNMDDEDLLANDWEVEISFSETPNWDPSSIQEGSFIFRIEDEEVFRITKNELWCRKRLLTTDQEILDGLRELLATAKAPYVNPGKQVKTRLERILED